MLTTSATLYNKRLTFKAEKTSEGYKVYCDQFPDLMSEARIIKEGVRDIIMELKFYIHVYGEVISKGIPMENIDYLQKVYRYFNT